MDMDDDHEEFIQAARSVPLQVASDSLLADYLHRLDVLYRLHNTKPAGPSKTPDSTLLRVHQEALERRSLVGLLEQGLVVHDELLTTTTTTAAARGHTEPLVSLPEILELDDTELHTWQNWRPAQDDLVLVYVSHKRGYWPGKIIDVDYFAPCAAPRIPRPRLYAVRVYPTKQRPILTLKSHMVPFAFRPNPPPHAPSTLAKAYRTAWEPLLYDIEALGIETQNQREWASLTDGYTSSGNDHQSWNEWRDWIEGQAHSETVRGETGDTIDHQAMSILTDLEAHGYPVFTNPPTTNHSTADPTHSQTIINDPSVKGKGKQALLPQQAMTTAAAAAPSKAHVKRARRRLTEVLQDPIIGPSMNQLNLGQVCRALIMPLKLDQASCRLVQSTTTTADDQIHSEALSHVLAHSTPPTASTTTTKRKRSRGDDIQPRSSSSSPPPLNTTWGGDFVSPLNGHHQSPASPGGRWVERPGYKRTKTGEMEL